MHKLDDILSEEGLATPYDDANLLRAHQADGHDPADVIYLSLGETWSEAAPGLRAALSPDLPEHCHGYILSPYGLPVLHRTLRDYITADHRLGEIAALGRDYEVAVSQNSTRNAMFHFGRLLLAEQPSRSGPPAIAIAPTPGWDYAGVFAPLGYHIRGFPLDPGTQCQPEPELVEHMLRLARRDTAGPVLLIINAQHNPTGANWNPQAVTAVIHAALTVGASLLIDDAYFALHDPKIKPTNALRALLEALAHASTARPPRWLAVRSLGKQFHCNGWGVGALTAAPETIELLATWLHTQYTYVSAVPLQQAMAQWLNDPASSRFLEHQRAEYARKRAAITARLTRDLAYPRHALFPGECAAYFLLPIPPWYQHLPEAGDLDYRRYCLARTNVLLGEAHMTTPGQPPSPAHGFVRMYLGLPERTLHTALDRMLEAGLTWQPP
jgi:N-succinyldiaminopimelate aminotransferase